MVLQSALGGRDLSSAAPGREFHVVCFVPDREAQRSESSCDRWGNSTANGAHKSKRRVCSARLATSRCYLPAAGSGGRICCRRSLSAGSAVPDERDLVHTADGLTSQHAATVLQPRASPARSMLTSRHTIVPLPRLQLHFTLNDVLVCVESAFFKTRSLI